MKPLNVAVLDHVVERGGGQLAIARLADALAPEVRMTFLLPEEGPFPSLLRGAGHPVEVVPIGEMRRLRIETIQPLGSASAHGPEVLVAAVRLARAIRRVRADVVYTNSLKAHVYGAIAARIAGIRHVAHVRDILAPPYLPLRLRRPLALLFAALPPAAVIANSGPTARAAPMPGLATVIPSGVIEQPRATPAPAGAAPRFAVLGRLERWKGHDVAIRAIAKVRRRLPGARLVVGGAAEAGEAAYAGELVELAEALGVADAVEFAGFVEDPYEFFRAAHVAIHTSVLPEPFGQVVVEALVVGRPVVATAAGGPVEILNGGRGGILVPPGDPGALAAVMVELMEDGELYARLAAAAVTRAGDFAIEVSAERTRALLEAVANGGSRRQVAALRGVSA